MIVKTLEIEIYLAYANSLKDKRRVSKSIIARLRQKFNVSVSEVADLDSVRDLVLGIAVITNNQPYADTVLDHCINLIESEYELEIIDIVRYLR